MHCYQEAASYYQVPAIVLRAIHHVEGGKRGDRVPDPNGTFDHGFMQINTCWKPMLHRQGWTMRFITDHDCANIFAAAWILKRHLDQTHNLWLSIADYHSGNLAYGYPYAKKVYQQVVRMATVSRTAMAAVYPRTVIAAVTAPAVGSPAFTPQNVRFVP